MLGWGIPIYQLNSTLSTEGGSKEPVQLFLFKVGISPLTLLLLLTNLYFPLEAIATLARHFISAQSYRLAVALTSFYSSNCNIF